MCRFKNPVLDYLSFNGLEGQQSPWLSSFIFWDCELHKEHLCPLIRTISLLLVSSFIFCDMLYYTVFMYPEKSLL